MLTPSEEEALARLGVRKKDLLVVLRELSKLSRENLPRQLIVGILTRVCKLASVVLQAGGTLGMQCKYMCVYCTVCLSKTITVCVCTLFLRGGGWSGVCVCAVNG